MGYLPRLRNVSDLVHDCGGFVLKTVRIIVGCKIMLGMW